MSVAKRMNALAFGDDWFDRMSPDEQKQYLEEHPNSDRKAGGAKPTGGEKPAGYLLPVIVSGGRMLRGQQGESHDDVASRHGYEYGDPDEKLGFINETGKFLDRERAADHARFHGLFKPGFEEEPMAWGEFLKPRTVTSERANERFAARADANPGNWFESLSPEQQKKYLEEHPHSEHKTGGVHALGEHLKTLHPKIQQKFSQLGKNSKQALHTWHDKSPTEKAGMIAHGVANVGKTAAHHAVHHVKHEATMYSHAAKALGHLATGKKWKDLEPEHKKHLKHAIVHAGLTAASMAMGDPTGHGAHALGIGDVLAHFAHEHAHHAAMLGGADVLAKTGRDAVKHATASEEPKKISPAVQREIDKAIKTLSTADIPTSEWIHILHEIEHQAAKKK